MLDPSFFFPKELKVYSVKQEESSVKVELESCQPQSICPLCGKASSKEHSRYFRKLMDEPIFGNRAYLGLSVRKFYCHTKNCERKIFTERFSSFIKSYARKTDRLKESLTALAFSSNAETGKKVSRKLSLPVSADTLLRLIRKSSEKGDENLKIIGVDDWAIKKGNHYGTIICNLETHKPVDVFPERSTEALEKWLRKHPGIEIATRDRSNSYRKAFNNTSPKTTQIADRFHLSKNLLDALKNFVKRTFGSRIHIGYKEIEIKKTLHIQVKKSKEKILSKAEKNGIEARNKKRKIVREVKKMYSEGKSISAIFKTMHLAKATIRRYLHLDEEEAVTYQSSTRSSILDPYLEIIETLIAEGKTASKIFNEIKAMGYSGGDRNVRRFVKRIKKEFIGPNISKTSPKLETKEVPKPKIKTWIKRYDLTSYMWSFPDELNEEGEKNLKVILKKAPLLEKIYPLIQDYRTMAKEKDHQKLRIWINNASLSEVSEIVSFSKGLDNDFEEVYNAFLYPYSNGVVEGHVNRLKMIKRQMYGRANLDLLRKKVLHQW